MGLGQGGPKAKFADNINAITTLRTLDAERRAATPDEQAIMARYVGWGGLPQAFDDQNPAWANEYAELKAILDHDAYTAARRSTQDAHYTPMVVLNGIYQGLERIGFTGGRILDAGAGTGHFIGAMPREMRQNSKFNAIELDATTAAIGKRLYPAAVYRNDSFQGTYLAPGSIDAVVGNPPFGSQPIIDKFNRSLSGLSIHNYFLAKSIEALRPGGVMGVVVSRYFMDAGDSSTRERIASQAHLLGAIRLPNNTFKENALTEVTTDILFFRKAMAGEQTDQSWATAGLMYDQETNSEFRISQYFINNPRQLLGDMRVVSSQYGFRAELLPIAGRSLDQMIERAIDVLPRDQYVPRASVDEGPSHALVHPKLDLPDQIKVESFFITPDREIARRIPDPGDGENYELAIFKNDRAEARVKGMIGIRDALRALMHAELTGTMLLAPDITLGETLASYSPAEREGDFGLDLSMNERTFKVYRQALEEPRIPAIHWRPSRDESETVFIGQFVGEQTQTIRIVRAEVPDAPGYVYFRAEQDDGIALASGPTAADAAAAADMAMSKAARAKVTLDELREDLNRRYDSFVKAHGHISSQANSLVMRDDVEYSLLTALEQHYDKGVSPDMARKRGIEIRFPSAQKAEIFSRRVLSPSSAVVEATDAADALAMSMNRYGVVNMGYMESVYGRKADEIREELRGLIYQDPESGRLVPAQRYLSGNVRRKLELAQTAAAKSPEYAENVRALQGVQPADIEAVDISVTLGAPWIPSADYEDFAYHILGNRQNSINYIPAVGHWNIRLTEGSRTRSRSAWGTERMGAHDILESLIKGLPIKIMDNIGKDDKGNSNYRLNADETAAANQKAEEMRQDFGNWIWSDQGRRDRLERLYNKIFNTNVVPRYDGSHLRMEGSSKSINWRPHQKDAVWRGIQEGGSLFDHRVGAGKTFIACAIAVESRRMGLAHKPMIVVPNHLLLQWKDEFYRAYPGSKILVAEKTDFSKENRQKLFSRISLNDWDAVIVAHSSFKKIGLPAEEENAILREQIDDITKAIIQSKADRGDRFTIKQMEKIKERIEARMDKIAATGSKDKSISFDELGVDMLVVDEAHLFKNLSITTSMSRVSGLGNIAGSDQAFDMFVKCRFLQKQQDGRGVHFMTGTPISNTIAELYTMNRFMRYDDMKERGIHHFDAWAKTFGQVVDGWELDATGVNYRLNSRFSKFTNVPELAAMYRTFADVITKRDLQEQAEAEGKRFPVPKLKTGRPISVIAERSPSQARFIGVQESVRDSEGQEMIDSDGNVVKDWNPGSIIHRMENLPKDSRIDNPLKITNEARKAGLDMRLIDPAYGDYAGSKVNLCINNIFEIYKEWDSRKGTQLVFCDLSTPKKSANQEDQQVAISDNTDEADEHSQEASISMDELLAGSSAAFSVYEDIKSKLIALGIAPEHIAFIHDASTDVQRNKLYQAMNEGEVRVLLGSTAKLGAGTNVQQRLVALHHLDTPWRPSDLEQRNGRGERQGNRFFDADPDGFELSIFCYSTKNTYDARMWQTIESKAAAIEQFRQGDVMTRVIDDIAGDAANAADMKAAASGNPLMLLQVQIASDLKKMEAIYSNFIRSKHGLEKRAAQLDEFVAKSGERQDRWRKEIAIRDQNTAGDDPVFTAPNGRKYGKNDPEALLEHLASTMKEARLLHSRARYMSEAQVGNYRGFTITVYATDRHVQFTVSGHSHHDPDNLTYGEKMNLSASGFIGRLDNFLGSFETQVIADEDGTRDARREAEIAKEQALAEFSLMGELEDLRLDARQVIAEIQRSQSSAASEESTWVPRSAQRGAPYGSQKQSIEPHPHRNTMSGR